MIEISRNQSLNLGKDDGYTKCFNFNNPLCAHIVMLMKELDCMNS